MKSPLINQSIIRGVKDVNKAIVTVILIVVVIFIVIVLLSV